MIHYLCTCIDSLKDKKKIFFSKSDFQFGIRASKLESFVSLIEPWPIHILNHLGINLLPLLSNPKVHCSKQGFVLDETNYDMWSQIMEMHIVEKEKLLFICGTS